MLKVIVAGGRKFDDYEKVKERLKFYLLRYDPSEIEIVSGGATGADALGERYAKEFGCQIKRFPAEWKKYGAAAGPMRNNQMAQYADSLIAFDTGGRGTANMIQQAKSKGLPVRVVNCR